MKNPTQLRWIVKGQGLNLKHYRRLLWTRPADVRNEDDCIFIESLYLERASKPEIEDAARRHENNRP